MWAYVDFDGVVELVATKREALMISGFCDPVGRRVESGFYEVVNRDTGEQRGYVGTIEAMSEHGFEWAFEK